jgi:hypothetical protein
MANRVELWGIAMSKLLWTIFLVVAFQATATASTALASPPAEKTTVAEALSASENATARLDAGSVKTAPGLRADSERKRQDAPEVLSKNFATPKPVQIYWFFGGR